VVYDPKDVIVPPFLPDTPACRAELAQYYQSVSRLDQGVGRVMELLKETGHWDDTLLIYIRAYIHRPEFELYDLQTDPHEVHNLAASPDHAQLLAELKASLKAFQKRTKDPWIMKWEYE